MKRIVTAAIVLFLTSTSGAAAPKECGEIKSEANKPSVGNPMETKEGKCFINSITADCSDSNLTLNSGDKLIIRYEARKEKDGCYYFMKPIKGTPDDGKFMKCKVSTKSDELKKWMTDISPEKVKGCTGPIADKILGKTQ